MCFYGFVFLKIFKLNPAENIENLNEHQEPVSVIICARDALFHLKKNLPSILNQQYPDFEVIVVNDRSTDGTAMWLDEMSALFPNLKVITHSIADKRLPGKRSALTAGIQAAKNDLLLMTDADCHPASDEWIQYMANACKPETLFVLGYSPCTEKPGWLNKLIRYENFTTALYYLTFSLAGMPYMGTGRNLLYRKSVGEYIPATSSSGIMTGDDDLLVNKIANGRNTALMIHPKSHMITESPASLDAFLNQKKRHYTAGYHYRFKHQLILGTLYLSHATFNVLIFPLLASGLLFIPVLIIFLFKNIFQLFINAEAMRTLQTKGLWIFTPLLDLCLSLFFVTLGSVSRITKTKKWK